MAALTLALLLAAALDLEVEGCGPALDAAALRRLVARDWAAPPGIDRPASLPRSTPASLPASRPVAPASRGSPPASGCGSTPRLGKRPFERLPL